MLGTPADGFKKGVKIIYDDGRPGHVGVRATIIDVNREAMTVQFDDRADTTRIAFADRGWMEFIKVEGS